MNATTNTRSVVTTTMSDLRAAWAGRFVPEHLDNVQLINALAYGEMEAMKAHDAGDTATEDRYDEQIDQLLLAHTGKRSFSLSLREAVQQAKDYALRNEK